jgi:DNA polymerase III subunit delta
MHQVYHETQSNQSLDWIGYTYYNDLTMILFLFGKDTFRSREQLKRMREKFKTDRDPQGLNVVVIDAEKQKPSQILEQILSMPFLAEKRFVVLENLMKTKEKELQKDLLKRIEEQTIADDTILVFWEGLEKAKTKDAKALFERLKQEKYAQEFPELKDRKLEAWIALEVESRGGKIAHAAVHDLAHHVGSDMWRLNNVIDQLVSYKNGTEIDTAAVQLFVEKHADDNIFNLVDFIVAKHQQKAFAMIQEQYKQGNDPGYIVAMLIRQFRILLQLRDLYDRDELNNSADVAKKLGLHPFVVKKSLSSVKKFKFIDLTSAYNQLLDIDAKTKTGLGDQSLLLDLFVSR